IDRNAESTLAGLYAVGEASGWQGADRLGGTMLGGSQVFGWRAGHHAGDACNSLMNPGIPDETAEAFFGTLRSLQAAKGTVGIETMRAELQDTMWRLLTVEKDAEMLDEARTYIRQDRERLANQLAIGEPLDYALAYEQCNLHDVAEAIIEASDLRTESRGPHCRSDYPKRDDQNWLTNIFATHVGGRLNLRRHWINEDHGWQDRRGDIRIRPWG
ncbi:MAG: hypothetical protein ACREQ1_04500, partial [Woeseiaceae bacterium]